MSYTVYILRCSDGTYYTGIARDLSARVVEHNQSSKGAKYTKARRPVKVVYSEPAENRSLAQKREYFLRKLPRTKKEDLINLHS